ncbi:DVUA0089 family protein, partial [Henriciella sp. AS95]|uniref:DVUA0089 family protein n=1 Tax=Henriciella sp. AS95 TaxID=3135782 RepID=UPI0031719CAE
MDIRVFGSRGIEEDFSPGYSVERQISVSGEIYEQVVHNDMRGDGVVTGCACAACAEAVSQSEAGETIFSELPTYTVAEIAEYLINGYWSQRAWASTDLTYDISELALGMQELAIQAMDAIASITSLTFTMVADGMSADITFDDEDSGAYTQPATSNGEIISAFINVEQGWADGSTALDSYTYQTFIHEIGHALGLGHSGPYNGSADYLQDAIYTNDSWAFTMMSYFSQSEAGNLGDFRYVLGPQQADIFALQLLYGENTGGTRSGDTIYGFNSTESDVHNFSQFTSAPSLTIYDTGGNDTLDFSGYDDDQIINLNGGAFSSVGGLQNVIAIMDGTVIENAIGGIGDDCFIGNDGDNVIDGGAGLDIVDYSAGNQRIIVNLLGDVVNTGGQGDDTLISIEGIVGTAFNDLLAGDANDNYFAGLGGNDSIDGRGGFDILSLRGATSGATITIDILNAGVITLDGLGTDTFANMEGVEGTDFDDLFIGGSGAETFWGAGGNDTFVVSDGGDTYVGGEGTDTLDFSAARSQVLIDLLDSTFLSGSAGGFAIFEFSSIEGIIGSNYADFIFGGTSAAMNVDGGDGDDTIQAQFFDDYLRGGHGNDEIFGWSGNDQIFGDDGHDVLLGEEGNDSIDGGFGDDELDGGTGNDLLLGDVGEDYLYGREGDDELNGGGGTDYLDGGTGNDLLLSGVGDDYLYGRDGNDELNGGGGSDYLDGGTGNDILLGGGGQDYLYGREGNDELNGGGGDDYLDGGPSGIDILHGGGGFDIAIYRSATSGISVNLLTGVLGGAAAGDTLISIEGLRGSAYDDELRGDAGDNSVNGAAGNDLIYGGDGNDFLDGGDGVNRIFGEGGNDTILVREGYISPVDEPDIIVPAGSGNTSIETALSLDGTFDLNANSAIQSSVTVPHTTVSGTGDDAVQYFSFTVDQDNAGVIIDIDGAAGGAGNFDSYLTLYDASGIVIASNDDDFSGDQGSASSLDSRIVTTLSEGAYVVAVGSYPALSPIPADATFDLHLSLSSVSISRTLEGGVADGGAGDDIIAGG